MGEEYGSISKSVSILYRLSQMFYDSQLSTCRIGCGQQFFLLMITKNPGITPNELAGNGVYDKGTTARAIQKLEGLGYIRRQPDTQDKRSCRLFTTPLAEQAVAATRKALTDWQAIITRDLSEEDVRNASDLLDRLAQNAAWAMKPLRKED